MMTWSPVPDLSSPGRPARVALAAAAVLALILVAKGYSSLGIALGDTDDAMRLQIVRDLVSGRGWFDTLIPRLEPPAGLDLHWSRLVDGGLALLDTLLLLVLPPEPAETATRLVWPLLWLFPLTLGGVLAARRLGGSAAVLCVPIFIAAFPVLMQFQPGRIDHHNVQMALAMLMLAGTMNLEARWGAPLAGIATGLMLAVGLEALVFAALCGVAVALRFVAEPDFAPAARQYALTLAASAALAFFAQTPPRLWAATECDMLAVNLLAGLVVAGAGLALAGFARGSVWTRLSALVLTGIVALGVYLALDPACLRGPYAHMDPRLAPIWLDHVVEVRALPTLFHEKPATAVAFIAPLLPVLLALPFALARGGWRDPAWLTAGVLFLAAFVCGLVMVRMTGYAAAFSAVVLAGALPRLFPERVASRLIGLTFAAVMLSPPVLSVLAAASFATAADEAESGSADACRESAAYASLSALPPGLVLADIDYGPDILAHTPHSVLAAPYHRLNEGLVTAHAIWSAPPAEALERLQARGVSYVMLCPARGKLPIAFPEGSLRTLFERGETPEGFEKISPGGVFQIWRVR